MQRSSIMLQPSRDDCKTDLATTTTTTKMSGPNLSLDGSSFESCVWGAGRKQKAKIAARVRRNREAFLIKELANELCIPSDLRLDKISVLRLAIDFLKARPAMRASLTNIEPTNTQTNQQTTNIQMTVTTSLSSPSTSSSSSSSSPESGIGFETWRRRKGAKHYNCVNINSYNNNIDNYSSKGKEHASYLYQSSSDECSNDTNCIALTHTTNAKHARLMQPSTNDNTRDWIYNNSNNNNNHHHYQVQTFRRRTTTVTAPAASQVQSVVPLQIRQAPTSTRLTTITATTTTTTPPPPPVAEQRSGQQKATTTTTTTKTAIPATTMTQNSIDNMPRMSTAEIFAPRTADTGSHFLILNKFDGKTVMQCDSELAAGDDLIYLAPQAGDSSISLEATTTTTKSLSTNYCDSFASLSPQNDDTTTQTSLYSLTDQPFYRSLPIAAGFLTGPAKNQPPFEQNKS